MDWIVPFIVCAVVFGIGFWAGMGFGRDSAQPALDDLRNLATARLYEIKGIEGSVSIMGDELENRAKEIEQLEKRLKSAEEFQDGVLELAGRLPVCDIMWKVSQLDTPKTTRVGADEPLGIVTKKSDT